MLKFDPKKERINLFKIGNTYIFNKYFKGDKVFSKMKDYYNNKKYRFEVPDHEIEKVKEILKDNSFEPYVVEDIEKFFVVKEKYTSHTGILKNSVLRTTKDNYNIFLMKDKLSVKKAVQLGAERFEDMNFKIKPKLK